MLIGRSYFETFEGVEARRLWRGHIVDREVPTNANDHKGTYIGTCSTPEPYPTWMDLNLKFCASVTSRTGRRKGRSLEVNSRPGFMLHYCHLVRTKRLSLAAY